MKQNRVVLVTGAAGGMGSAVVERFLQNEDFVIAMDREADGLEKLASQYPSGDRFVTVTGDVSNEADCQRAVAAAERFGGEVNVLVHAAGHFPVVPFEEMTFEEWRRIIDINLTGAFLMTKAVLPKMKGRGWGRIVLFGSASVFEGVPGQAHYVAAKAGIIVFARSIAMELGGFGITVNIVAPGLTLTPPVRDSPLKEFAPLQRKLRAISRDEVAGDLVGPTFFLASPDADFMSGQLLCVDGGKSKH